MASRAEVEAAALLARYRRHFFDPDLPVPVDAIAVDLLGLSVDEDEPLEASGMLIPADSQIWLNAAESRRSPGRRRFTLAHELGHWVCHTSRTDEPTYCRSDDIGVGWPQARAGGERVRRRSYSCLSRSCAARRRAELNLHALAHRFGVSVPAMQVRLETLDLLPEYMR